MIRSGSTTILALCSLLAAAGSRARVAGCQCIGRIFAPDDKCLGVVTALTENMAKNRYSLGGARDAAGYGSAGPGYEIRTLMASATVPAHVGQERVYLKFSVPISDFGSWVKALRANG